MFIKTLKNNFFVVFVLRAIKNKTGGYFNNYPVVNNINEILRAKRWVPINKMSVGMVLNKKVCRQQPCYFKMVTLPLNGCFEVLNFII
jgi:excinuclease UvrABC nuclease subunit